MVKIIIIYYHSPLRRGGADTNRWPAAAAGSFHADKHGRAAPCCVHVPGPLRALGRRGLGADLCPGSSAVSAEGRCPGKCFIRGAVSCQSGANGAFCSKLPLASTPASPGVSRPPLALLVAVISSVRRPSSGAATMGLARFPLEAGGGGAGGGVTAASRAAGRLGRACVRARAVTSGPLPPRPAPRAAAAAQPVTRRRRGRSLLRGGDVTPPAAPPEPSPPPAAQPTWRR